MEMFSENDIHPYSFLVDLELSKRFLYDLPKSISVLNGLLASVNFIIFDLLVSDRQEITCISHIMLQNFLMRWRHH